MACKICLQQLVCDQVSMLLLSHLLNSNTKSKKTSMSFRKFELNIFVKLRVANWCMAKQGEEEDDGEIGQICSKLPCQKNLASLNL